VAVKKRVIEEIIIPDPFFLAKRGEHQERFDTWRTRARLTNKAMVPEEARR
jgi:hypothetical protein